MGEVPAQRQGPGTGVSGEHRPAMRVLGGWVFAAAAFWAVSAGWIADTLAIVRDPNFGTDGYISLPKRVVATTAAALVVGGCRLWVAWRGRAQEALVWDDGGLAYRLTARVHGAIGWRDVTSVRADGDTQAPGVIIEGNVLGADPDFELTVGSAGQRPGGRWSVWSYSQQELIDALQAARAAGLASRFPPPVPSVPPAPGFPRAWAIAWLVLAVSIAAVLIAVDRTAWFNSLMNHL